MHKCLLQWQNIKLHARVAALLQWQVLKLLNSVKDGQTCNSSNSSNSSNGSNNNK
jgi:hypothetical protein